MALVVKETSGQLSHSRSYSTSAQTRGGKLALAGVDRFNKVKADPTVDSPANVARRARSTTGRRGSRPRTTADPALGSRPRTIIPTVGAL